MSKSIILLTILFLISCGKTIVSYDEKTKNFVIKKGKSQAGTLTLSEGDNCQVVDDIMIVCGQ